MESGVDGGQFRDTAEVAYTPAWRKAGSDTAQFGDRARARGECTESSR